MNDKGLIRSRAPLLAALILVTVATVIALLYFQNVLKRIQLLPDRHAAASFRIQPDLIQGSNALLWAESLCEVGPRESGSAGAEAAAALLLKQVQFLGLKASLDMFSDNTPDGKMTFRNVIGIVPGNTNAVIVLVSHFDTKSGIGPSFIGANDSASSSGLLLELARVLVSNTNQKPEFVFAFVDGEECRREYAHNDGLHGSRRLAEWLNKHYRRSAIRGAIVLDMIGDKDLTITIPRNSARKLVDIAFRAAEEEGQRQRVSLYPTILDDHVSLINAGIPAIDIIDFQYGSGPGKNDYWHTNQDSMDKLSAESLQIVGRITLRMINALSEKP